MRFETKLIATILLALSWVAPASSNTPIPSPQTIAGQEIAAAKAEYENANAQHQKRIEQFTEAVLRVSEAQEAYEAALMLAARRHEATIIARDEAAQNVERFTALVKIAEQDVARLLAQGKSEESKEVRDAREIEQRYKADLAGFISSLQKWTDEVNGQVNFRDIPEAKRKLDNALSQKHFVGTLLDDSEQELTEAFEAYSSVLLRNPPPYLKEIKVRSGRGDVYHARWEPTGGGGEGSSSQDRLRLINEKSEIRAALTELELQLKTNSDDRLAIAQLMHRNAIELTRQAKVLGDNTFYKEVSNGIIDYTSSVFDVFATGGAVTASEIVLRQVVANAAQNQGPKLAKIGVIKLAETVAPPKEKDPSSPLQGDVADDQLTTIIKQGAGDALDHLAASSSPSADTYLNLWDRIKGTNWRNGSLVPPAGGRLNQLASEFKAGAPRALVDTGVKLIVNQYFNGQIAVAQRAYLRLMLETQAQAEHINRSLVADRASILHRRALQVALADLDYRLKLGGSSLTKHVLLDNPLTREDFEDGSIQVLLTFSQVLSEPPAITINKNLLRTVDRVDTGPSMWRASNPASKVAPSSKGRLEVFVGAGAGNEPFKDIDGQPRTLAKLDYESLQWTMLELPADLTHKVQYRVANFDLTGLWRRQDGTVFSIKQDGDTILATHNARSSRFPYDAGDRHFSGTLRTGTLISGQMVSRVPRVHRQQCRTDYSLTFELLVKDDGNTLEGLRDALSVSTSDCTITRRSKAKDSYTRLLNDDGTPQQLPSAESR